jgi:hypothetical protein
MMAGKTANIALATTLGSGGRLMVEESTLILYFTKV